MSLRTKAAVPLVPLDDPSLPVDEPRRARRPRRPRAETPEDVAPWYRRQFHFGGSSVKPQVLLAFSRQLSSFLEAGISIIAALEIVAEETESPEMLTVVEKIKERVERGGSFADAAAEHSKVFPAYYLSMLVSAQYTGKLDVVLDQLATYIERDIAAKQQVKSALTYPVIVLIVACVAMVVMSVFVLPKFSALYRSLEADLPLPTRMLLSFTDVVTKGWPLIMGGALALALLWYAVAGGTHGKQRRDRIVMHVPVLGGLFHLISIERFCRVLAALATSGVPLPQAIAVSADSTNNSIFVRKLSDVRDVVVRGGGLSAPILESGLFPVAARQMIRVGEQTGALGEQLNKAATYYEREVGFKIKRALDLFEPMVILVVGLVVAFVAVAQVSAMYSVFSQID